MSGHMLGENQSSTS